MSNVTFNKEEEKILELGLNYAFEKPIKHFLQDLIIDMENAIKHVDAKLQNIYRFLACKKLKQLQNTNTNNTLHKRQLYVTKADKGKTIVIVNKDIIAHGIKCGFLIPNFTNSGVS
jgi:hypothetical protein